MTIMIETVATDKLCAAKKGNIRTIIRHNMFSYKVENIACIKTQKY